MIMNIFKPVIYLAAVITVRTMLLYKINQHESNKLKTTMQNNFLLRKKNKTIICQCSFFSLNQS